MKEVKNMKIYELAPTDGRKSFYGKAKVIIDNNGTVEETLCRILEVLP